MVSLCCFTIIPHTYNSIMPSSRFDIYSWRIYARISTYDDSPKFTVFKIRLHLHFLTGSVSPTFMCTAFEFPSNIHFHPLQIGYTYKLQHKRKEKKKPTRR